MAYKKPIAQLSVGEQAIDLHGRLMSLHLEDRNGMNSDMLTIELDDHDGKLEIPPKGTKLTVAFGFEGELLNKGEYVVDEITHTGPPDKLSIRASSADFRESFTEGRELHYDNQTLAGIISTIAGRNGLTPRIAAKYSSIFIEHLDQQNESDAHIVTRLAEQYSAIATVKNGMLIFVERGSGQTASGEDLPPLVVKREDTTTHTYSEFDRDAKITGVIAYYHDTDKAKRIKVVVGSEQHANSLRTTYPNEMEAREAAQSALQEIKSRGKKFECTLAFGRADCCAEQPVILQGFKSEFFDADWYITQATHELSSNGYTTQLQVESIKQTRASSSNT